MPGPLCAYKYLYRAYKYCVMKDTNPQQEQELGHRECRGHRGPFLPGDTGASLGLPAFSRSASMIRLSPHSPGQGAGERPWDGCQRRGARVICNSQSQPWGAQSWWDWTEPLSQKPPGSDYLWEPCFQPFSHSFPQAVIQQTQSAHSVPGAVLPSGSILPTPTGQGLTPFLHGPLALLLSLSFISPLLKAPFLKVPASAQELRGPHCSQEKRGHGQHPGGGPHSDKGGAEAWVCNPHQAEGANVS